MMDYAFNHQNIWSRLSVIIELKAEEHNESIHYIQHKSSDKAIWEFYLQRKGRKLQTLWSLLSVSLLIFNFCPPLGFSLSLLMLLYVVTPRPAIRHHRCLICSYSLGSPVCLLIPSTSSSTFSFFPWSLLSAPLLPVVHLGENKPEMAV